MFLDLHRGILEEFAEAQRAESLAAMDRLYLFCAVRVEQQRNPSLVREWRAQNHERVLSTRNAWNRANPESRAASAKKWREKNLEKLRAREKARRKADRALRASQ